MISEERQAEVIARVESLEAMDDVRELAALLTTGC